ncbi:SMP-30/gluconolactonase/LRE family protein [Caulobacter sp. 1776]|uniref:SMP-30/gluconolactonase/LRE family protein n=1 Tax=Caulobacter sp. 1776 TaxID=3156420 RepID=UPI003397606C
MTTAFTRRAFAASLAALPTLAHAARPVVGRVERLDPALDVLIDANAPVETILDGFTWSEGPVWVGGRTGYLLASDVPANRIMRWSPATGAGEVWLTPSGRGDASPISAREAGTNGLIVARGGLVAADSGNRALVRIDLATKRRTVLCAGFEGRRFNSPNDLVLAKDGAIYFTDPPWGLKGTWESPYREMDYFGVFRLSPDGEVSLVDKSLQPNGIGLSPDNRTLYVTDRDTGWVAITLDAKGRPTDRRMFVDRGSGIQGGDGLKVDRRGNVWASSKDGISIFAPDGRRLGVIRADDVISNCVFGADGFLYMSSNKRLIRAPLRRG